MNKRELIRWSVLILLLAGMIGVSLHAQVGRGTQRIKGTIVDEKGRPVQGAEIVIKFKGHYRLDMNTKKIEFQPAREGVQHTTKSDKNGKWRFIGLGFGQWEVVGTIEGKDPAYNIVILDENIDRRPVSLTLRKLSPATQTPLSPAPAAGETSGQSQLKESDPKKLMELGEELMEYDELDKAAFVFKKVIEKKPKWSKPYLKLGYTYFNMGKMELALENFKKFLEMDPKSPEADTVNAIVESLKEM